jgi:hypothetical protein
MALYCQSSPVPATLAKTAFYVAWKDRGLLQNFVSGPYSDYQDAKKQRDFLNRSSSSRGFVLCEHIQEIEVKVID